MMHEVIVVGTAPIKRIPIIDLGSTNWENIEYNNNAINGAITKIAIWITIVVLIFFNASFIDLNSAENPSAKYIIKIQSGEINPI
jgi:hypothetical protein